MSGELTAKELVHRAIERGEIAMRVRTKVRSNAVPHRWTESQRQKFMAASSRRWTPDARARHALRMKARVWTPEGKALQAQRISEGMRRSRERRLRIEAERKKVAGHTVVAGSQPVQPAGKKGGR